MYTYWWFLFLAGVDERLGTPQQNGNNFIIICNSIVYIVCKILQPSQELLQCLLSTYLIIPIIAFFPDLPFVTEDILIIGMVKIILIILVFLSSRRFLENQISWSYLQINFSNCQSVWNFITSFTVTTIHLGLRVIALWRIFMGLVSRQRL